MTDSVFYKMQGSGNDFILFDNNQLQLPEKLMPVWAKQLCPRAFGIGADGMIFLESINDTQAAYKWHFYNADGSRAEMCGNGSRCAAKLAFDLGLAPKHHSFLTDAGLIKAEIFDENDEVRVQLTPVKNRKTNISLEDMDLNIHFADTGVPHVVVISEDVAEVDVQSMGKKLRFHTAFAPAGANINFIQIKDRANLLLRTYERGVEAETFACGTGAAASVVITHALGLTENKVKLITSGQEKLEILVQGDTPFLKGKAIKVYQGLLNNKAFNLEA